MKRIYLTIVTLIVILILLIDSVRLRVETNKIQNDLDNIKNVIDINISLIEKNKKQDSIELENYKNIVSPNYDVYINRLKNKGLNDPLEIIRNSLMRNHDLIPNRNTPKGKLYFQRSSISIITDNWVKACYEEGHFGGELLLEMDIDEKGRIEWTVLDDNR